MKLSIIVLIDCSVSLDTWCLYFYP